MPALLHVPNRKLFFAGFVVCSLIWMISYYESYRLRYGIEEIPHVADPNYLVSSSKCKIIDMDPFSEDAMRFYKSEKYISCNKSELLTYVTKTDNIATLHINKEIIPSYSSKGVSCCYFNVTRTGSTTRPDEGFNLSECQEFDNNVTLHHDTVRVKCTGTDNKRRQLYENAHVAITINDDVQKKIDNIDKSRKQLSVLLVGIDSISRLNFIRTLPNTYKYLEQNEWVSLKGYNKIDDNTFPNVMAILTGFNQSYACDICKPGQVGGLDKCPILWYDFQKLGYITGFAEDEAAIHTFNIVKKGFQSPPTNYYFRPYILASEKLAVVYKEGMTYCTGPETAGERVLNVALDFATTFKKYPNLGFFWMNSFSHNYLNAPTRMDDKIKTFLIDLENGGVLENSIVIFLSDHGMRFGDIRLTETGWLEERLPFIYFSFPQWFKENFVTEFWNFRKNTLRLTSPYDIHMTLKHILVMSGHNYSMDPGDACPKCKSLFEEAAVERSCEEAGIPQHWCTCAGYTVTKLAKEVEKKVTGYILSQIHEAMRSKNSNRKCAEYTVDKVMSTSLSYPFQYKNDTYLLVRFQTNPKAVFEVTINFKGDIKDLNYSISGDISRLDSYDAHSKCVKNVYLKKYCYCRSSGPRI